MRLLWLDDEVTLVLMLHVQLRALALGHGRELSLVPRLLVLLPVVFHLLHTSVKVRTL